MTAWESLGVFDAMGTVGPASRAGLSRGRKLHAAVIARKAVGSPTKILILPIQTYSQNLPPATASADFPWMSQSLETQLQASRWETAPEQPALEQALPAAAHPHLPAPPLGAGCHRSPSDPGAKLALAGEMSEETRM